MGDDFRDPESRAALQRATSRVLTTLWEYQILDDPAVAALAVASVLADLCYRYRLDYREITDLGGKVYTSLVDNERSN